MLQRDAYDITLSIVIKDRVIIEITGVSHLGCTKLEIKRVGVLEISAVRRPRESRL
ncbi:MAG: hypothetical protein ORN51_14220 [Akkermansiaceae bacterium]|nr:hypothetical protein [Akkermansiaceae bacterium]